jgi:hypothetical protein
MRPDFSLKLTARSVRCVGLGLLLAALPLGLSADTITADFDFTLNGLSGTGTFTYDPSVATATTMDYVDADSGDGLDSLSLTYNSNTYSTATALDYDPSLAPPLPGPTVFLPGNPTNTNGLQYDIFGFWVVSGSCTGISGFPGYYTCTGTGPDDSATLLGLSRTDEVFLASNVTSAYFSGAGDSLGYVLGGPIPAVNTISGTITYQTPEPSALPLLALSLAGLWFLRRRGANLRRT